MGTKDTAGKAYLKGNKPFADLVNGTVFHGREVIRPEDLVEMDSTEALADIVNDKLLAEQRWRDVLKVISIKKAEGKCYIAVVGVENQTKINYAMVVKDMLYDAINYAGQVQEIGARNKTRNTGSGRKVSSAEFLSGYGREDYLLPVITIAVYWGADRWDGPRCLHDMFQTDIPQEILDCVPDYRLNLLVPEEVDLDLFHTDLKQVLKIAKASNDKEQTKKLIETDEAFQSIDHDAAVAIKGIMGLSFKIPRKEKVNMSTAAKEWAKEERAAGVIQGKEEGGFSELCDLVADGDLSLAKAVARAKKYGVNNEDEFRKRAVLLGKKIS